MILRALFLLWCCGIVTFASHEEAENALKTLDGCHNVQDSATPMTLKWAIQKREKRRMSGPQKTQGWSFSLCTDASLPYYPKLRYFFRSRVFEAHACELARGLDYF